MNEAEVKRLMSKLPRRRAEIAWYVWSHPEGATADELRRAFKLDSPNQVAPDVTGLVKDSILEWRGQYRPTELGARAKVYHLAGQVAQAEPPWMGCGMTLSGRHVPQLGYCAKCGERKAA